MNCPRCDAPAKTETLRALGGVCEKCLLDFAAEKDAPAFPNLKILRTLGEGGMGVVYEAEQTALGRKVALKVLSPALASDPSFVERFTREAKALAQLTHPNIVGIHEFGVHDGVPYLVMEYVEGVSLRKVVKKLDSVRALEIVPQICDALAYAHSRGVVHRDIKPENILLDAQGRVKIADFGLAKLAEPDQTRITRTNVVMGTPHYMAPEQMENPGSVDHRADLFSLGVVFYEMLTGELPLGRFKAPSERADVDRRLDPVVLKSLERSPADRWQSADAMKERVTRLEPAEPVPSNPAAWISFFCLAASVPLALSVSLVVPGAAWKLGLSAALPALLAAIGFAIIGILKAPKVGGRRRGIAPAIVTLCVLGALVLVAIALSVPSSPSGKGESSLTALTCGLLVGLGGWHFMGRRTFIQSAWFLLAGALGLLILSFELERYKTPLALAALAGVAGANVLAVMGLVSLRGRPAGAAKVAGWAVPVLTLLAVGGFMPSSSASKPPGPPEVRGTLSVERVGDFKIPDLWLKPEELPDGQRYGTAEELAEVLRAAGRPLNNLPGTRVVKPWVLMPARVLLIGLEFEGPAERGMWEGRRGPPPAGWSERRLIGNLSVLLAIHARGDEPVVDVLWTSLKGSLDR